MKIPILSRLELSDYLNLIMVILTLLIEGFLRMFVSVLPNNLMQYLRGDKSKQKKKRNDIEHFCDVEYHYTTTKDNFVLCVHRLPNPGKPVILLWHGFMMCSEVFVCPRSENSLAKFLHALGYDVWLGNSRGNKYSKKHLKYATNSQKYWNFSLDEIVHFDIPAVVDYVLTATESKTLSYIGFSQGSAQIFAALSNNSCLETKINKVIALAAVLKPSPLRQTIPAALIQSSPAVLFLIFGRQSILRVAAFWARALNNKVFAKVLDISMNILFGWSSEKIDDFDKVIDNLFR